MGKIEVFFDSGIRRVHTYEDDKHINYGEVKVWNEDGSMAFSGNWIEGRLFRQGDDVPFSAKITVKYKDGTLNEQTDLIEGHWHDKQVFWSREGVLTSECQFEKSIIVDCEKK